jgi:hypothetical protein
VPPSVSGRFCYNRPLSDGASTHQMWIFATMIDDVAVGDHEDRIEDLLLLCIVQVGKEVRGPGDRVGLTGASRVLDQVLDRSKSLPMYWQALCLGGAVTTWRSTPGPCCMPRCAPQQMSQPLRFYPAMSPSTSLASYRWRR